MEDNLALIRQAQAGDAEAVDALIRRNSGLIWSVAKRFFGRGQDPDDLYQLGCLGMLKAISGFDLSYGTQFSTYAVPKISGEIMRFLRDDSMVKVSRGMKERAMKLRQTRSALEQRLGREPTLSELAAETGQEAEEIAAALAASGFADSLEQESGANGVRLEMLLSDHSEERMLEHVALRAAVQKLPLREQKVIGLRFYRGMTQQRAAAVLQISQVQVSRVERRAIELLRQTLSEEPAGANTGFHDQK